ncbi:MAG: hypothetical protein EX271_11130 [Acidimicrobiales bacterium]|nr:hypothetical protein [Hyphomonadaceae bacterium]RZV38271.1 MAG: hypothetical protein EX271_11130 [Acidimicrobiales bacterium]
MKQFFSILMGIIALTLVSACGGKATPEQLIVGTWVTAAPVEETENGMTMKFDDMQTSFNKDKTTASSGKISMSGAMLPQAMEMTIDTTGTWSIDGMVISQTITDADVKMTTNIPGMPDLGPVIAQGMIAEGATTSTILSIDKKSLLVKIDSTGTEMEMKKK